MAIAINDETGEVLTFNGNDWVVPPMANNPNTGKSVYFDGNAWVPMPTPKAAPAASAAAPTVPTALLTAPEAVDLQRGRIKPALTQSVPPVDTTDLFSAAPPETPLNVPTAGETTDATVDEPPEEVPVDALEAIDKAAPKERPETPMEKTIRELEAKKAETGRLSFFEGVTLRKAKESQAQMNAGKILGKVAINTITGLPEAGMLLTEIFAPETATAIQESDIGHFVSSVLDKIDPQFDTPEEAIVADLATYLTIGGAVRKLGIKGTEALIKRYGKTKAEGLVKKLQKAAPQAVGATAAAASVPFVDVQLRDSPDTPGATAYVTKEKRDLAEALELEPEAFSKNPEDPTYVGDFERNALLPTGKAIYDFLDESYLGKKVINFFEEIQSKPDDPINVKRKNQLLDSISSNLLFGAATGAVVKFLKVAPKAFNKVLDLPADARKIEAGAIGKQLNPKSVIPDGETSTVVAAVTEPRAAASRVANDNVGGTPRGVNDNFEGSSGRAASDNLEAGAPRVANDNLNVAPSRVANDNLGGPSGTAAAADDALDVPSSRGAADRLDDGTPRGANDNLNLAPSSAANQNLGPPTPPTTPPAGVSQRSFVAEKLASINTGLGRLFTSRAALPEELFQTLEKGSNNFGTVSLEIKKDIRDIIKIQKKNKVPDELINDYLAGKPVADIPEELIPLLDKVKKGIGDNENKINDLLGLSGEDRIGLSLDKGDIYLTRFYETANNPAYVERIMKALYGKSADADSLGKIDNARTYFKTLIKREANETLDAYNNHIDGVIETVVKNVAKEDSGILDIFSGVNFRGNAKGTQVKALKARQDISPEVRELLGEVKSPVDRISTTLATQRKIITKLEMLRGVENFAEENMGKPVKLPGLFPFLPSKVTTFKPKEGLGVIANLEGYANKIIGSLGGGKTDILKDVFTSPQMSKYIDEGLEVFMPNRQGSAIVDLLGKASSFAQAKQTLFNLPGYLLQVSGNLQTLVANGHLFNLALPKTLAKEIATFAKKVTLKDPAAVARLDKLIEAGILQSDITGSIITKGANLYGKEPKKLFSRTFNKTMSTLGEAFSVPDSYTKMVMVTLEEKALKKAFPKLTDDQIFDMAVNRIKDAAPTYGRAVPAVRGLSKLPFSNFPLFAAEMYRTQKNVALIGFKDLITGAKTGNGQLFFHGLKRVGGLLATLGGIGMAVDSNNDANGITDNQKQIVNLLSPDWNKGSTNLFLEPFVVDKTKGQNYIRTRYVSSGYFDQTDSMKGVVRLALAKLFKTGNLSPTELDKNLKFALETATSSYTSPKFLTQAAINVVSGVDTKTGKPIYDQAAGATVADKIVSAVKELSKSADPATRKVISEYAESLKSEGRLGEGLGENAQGFPMNSKDYEMLLTTGMRPTTVNVNKAIGLNLFKDFKAINQLDANFYDFISKEVATVPYTADIEKSIVEKYKELQDRKLEATKDVAKKVKLFSDLEYLEKTKENSKGIKKKLGNGGVYLAVTNNGTFKADPELIYAFNNAKASIDKGIFIPDMYAGENKLINSLLAKRYTVDEMIKVNKALAAASKDYFNNNKRSLKDK